MCMCVSVFKIERERKRERDRERESVFARVIERVTVMSCTVLYHNVPKYTEIYCFIRRSDVYYYFYCTVLHCTILCHVMLCCIQLNFILFIIPFTKGKHLKLTNNETYNSICIITIIFYSIMHCIICTKNFKRKSSGCHFKRYSYQCYHNFFR